MLPLKVSPTYSVENKFQNTDVTSMLVNTISSPPGNSPCAFDGNLSHRESLYVVHLLISNKRVILKLTCDKLSSLLEVSKYEVGHHVKACKQEYTDLQERQKRKKKKT